MCIHCYESINPDGYVCTIGDGEPHFVNPFNDCEFCEFCEAYKSFESQIDTDSPSIEDVD